MRNASKASTRKMLLRAMHLDDASEFRSILDNEGWPQDSSWSDYELLTHAIKHNHRRITHVLLDKKARIDKPRQRNYSLLHLAAVNKSAGWARVIDRLLSRGACVADKNGKGQTALHRAFEIGAPDDVLETLLKAHLAESSSEVFNRDMLGFVHVAATRPSLNAVRQLVEADETLVNWQVSLKSSYSHAGYTPLHFAVEHGRLENAEFLLHRGADIHRQNASGSTVLHLALELRNIEMIDLILRFDETKTNRVNNFGVSHFMAACAGSNESLVVEYLRSPSTTNALLSSQVLSPQDSYPNSGYTPLHFAAEFGRRHTVELLLSRGADCCILTPHNISAHLLAHANNHVKIADLLDKQCHSRRGFTEASKIPITRYDTLIEHDEHGDVMISFAKRGRFDSSSEEDSDESSDVDIARLSHDDLVSFFVNENSPDAIDQAIANFEYDFLQSSDGEPVCDNIQHFEQVPLSFAPSNFAVPSYDAQIAVPDQFSVPIDNQFVFFNATASYPTNVSVSSTLAQVPPFSPTRAIQVPNVYSVPWSPTSQNYFDFAAQPISVDSGLSFSNSSVGSNFSDSGVDDTYSQNGTMFTNPSNLAYQDNVVNYLTPQSFENNEPIDLSGFVPVATSTPIYNVPAAIDMSISFNQVMDVNNNQFVNGDKGDCFYRSISFP